MRLEIQLDTTTVTQETNDCSFNENCLGQRTLFASIIQQAYRDASSQRQAIREEALEWLDSPMASYYLHLLGFDDPQWCAQILKNKAMARIPHHKTKQQPVQATFRFNVSIGRQGGQTATPMAAMAR